MVKVLKNMILSLSVILLFSCATKEEENNSAAKFTIVDENSVQEEVSDIAEQKTKIVSNNMKDSIDNISNGEEITSPNSRVKKVKYTKIIVKPVKNYNRELHNLSEKEIESFLDDIDNDEPLEDNKNYDSPVKTLMENYRNILKTSSACCVSSISENLKMSGVPQDAIVSILSYDAANDGIADRCIVFSENDIAESFKNDNLANIVKKSRRDCICNNKDFLRKNINNFYRLYNADEEFYNKPLIYKYKDKTGDIIEDDVNEAVLNMALTLESCP